MNGGRGSIYLFVHLNEPQCADWLPMSAVPPNGRTSVSTPLVQLSLLHCQLATALLPLRSRPGGLGPLLVQSADGIVVRAGRSHIVVPKHFITAISVLAPHLTVFSKGIGQNEQVDAVDGVVSEREASVPVEAYLRARADPVLAHAAEELRPELDDCNRSLLGVYICVCD